MEAPNLIVVVTKLLLVPCVTLVRVSRVAHLYVRVRVRVCACVCVCV